MYVRWREGEELNDTCIQMTVKDGGGGIMVWGCINARGVGILDKVAGRLNADGYIDVRKSLIPTLDYHFLHSNFVFHKRQCPALSKNGSATEGLL